MVKYRLTNIVKFTPREKFTPVPIGSLFSRGNNVI